MNSEQILMLLMAIVLIDFIVDRVLAFLNDKHKDLPIPDELKGIYSQNKYGESLSYQKTNHVFGEFSAAFSFVLTFMALFFGWFGWLDQWIRNFSSDNLVIALVFFGVIWAVGDIGSIPFQLYKIFVIEERFGFNKMSGRTFILDKLKSYLLTIIFGGLIISIFIYLIEWMGSSFWVYFLAVIAFFMIFINIFYTSIIIPLFNKLTPLEDGELRQSINSYSKKVGFPLKNILMIDGSKRSKKGNAFFSGLWGAKKIVLYDTLISQHSVEELTAVLAHEVGHYKKKHILTMTILSLCQITFMLFLLSLMLSNGDWSFALGGSTASIHLNVLAFGILYTPLSKSIGVLFNLLSRRHEFQADRYAGTTFSAKPLISALMKMSSDHLSNLNPHPAYVFVYFSHPALLQRVRALQQLI